MLDGIEIGHRSRAAHAILHRQLVIANAFLVLAIDVVIARNTGFDASLNNGI